MPSHWPTARRILEQALDLPAAERAGFVRTACEGDEGLLTQVERLLDLETRASGAIELVVDEAWSEAPPALKPAVTPPTHAGRFRLVRVLAAGGMGTVYEAEQEAPSRRVAVKVMHHGLGGTDGASRFRFEVEVLGRLKHPGIAQVLDAGTSVDGQGVPYFAMEFVDEARTILEYASENELGTSARIALFLQACDAVHFGHQSGIVHRDIKPGNVLVNGRGDVKLIDFGIARAIGPDAHSRTRETRAGELVGTPQYMSPEQFGQGSDIVGTGTDVYSLGVLLYELLTGALPHDLEERSLIEIASAVATEPPVRPRLRAPRLDADLEWILLCALEHEPSERYASASELAADLRRHLAGEPVLVGPPSGAYRLRKFIRRHALAVGAAAAVVAALALGAAGTTVGMVRAWDAESTARTEATRAEIVNGLLFDMLHSPYPGAMGANVRMVDVLRGAEYDALELRDHPSVEAQFNQVIGSGLLRLGDYDAAVERLELALERAESGDGPDARTTLDAMDDLATSLVHVGDRGRARSLFDEAQRRSEARYGKDDPLTLDLEGSRCSHFFRRGSDERLEGLQRVFERCASALGREHALTVKAQRELAFELERHARFDDATALIEDVVEIEESRGDATRLAARYAVYDLARLLIMAGDASGAEVLLDELAPEWEQRFGPGNPAAAMVRLDQAFVKKTLRKNDEAIAILDDVLEQRLALYGESDVANLRAICERAELATNEGDFETSIEWSARAVPAAVAAFGPVAPEAIFARNVEARALLLSGRDEEAADALVALVDDVEQVHGPRTPHLVDPLNQLTRALLSLDPDAAVEVGARSVEIARESVRPHSPTRLTAIAGYSYALLQAGDFETAEASLLELLELARVDTATREMERTALVSLVELFTATGDAASAAAYRAELGRL